MGRIARAHDTSICENPSNGSKPTADRFALMLLHLSGEPMPSLPDVPGRVIAAPRVTDDDPLAEQWDRDYSPARPAQTERIDP